ncbi:MAG: hypothetical protein IKN66_10985 [Ruminococcus sp.]|nr:hypothetical protein [Ruminococcus sp.]
MKKLILLLTSIVGLCLTSCGSAADNSTYSSEMSPAQTNSSAASSEEKPQGETSNDKDAAEKQDIPEASEKQDNVSTSSDTLPLNKEKTEIKLLISVNGQELTASFADGRAAEELAQKLKNEPITVSLEEYGGFEKVGGLPWPLTKDDEQTDTEPCDIMLYQGNQMTIFYGTNSWSYTRLGHIDNITQEELKSILGEDDVTVTLSLK